MAALRIAIACVLLAILPRSAVAAISLSVSKVGVVPPSPGISWGVALGGDYLIDAGPYGQQQLFNFDGQSLVPVLNPHGAYAPSVGLPLDGFAASALEGVVFKDEFYFNAATPNGTSLFRTDGQAIELVTDLDPSNDTTNQTISYLIATDSSLFVWAQGQNGRALFRTDGTGIVELDLNSGPDLTGIYQPRRLGNEIVFHGTSTAPDLRGQYVAGANGVRFLANAAPVTKNMELWKGRLYWPADDELYQYDGAAATMIPQLSGIEFLDLRPTQHPSTFNDEFLTLTGRGPRGWAIYTWDGATVEEFVVDPTGQGQNPYVLGFVDGGFYYTRSGLNGNELYFTDGSTITEYDILPGPNSSHPDIFSATTVNGVIVFQAIGPKGKEAYRLQNRNVELLADINPTGDAFPFSAEFGTVYEGELYFRAYSPATGDEIFKTDGESVSLVADAIPGSAGSGGNYSSQVNFIGDFPLATFEVLFSNHGASSEMFATDGDSFASIDAAVGLGSQGNRGRAGIIPYGRDLLYFAQSGEVFRVSVVPEPATSILVVALVLGLSRIREQGICRKSPSSQKKSRPQGKLTAV